MLMPNLVNQYQEILELSKKMLEHANLGDWDNVIDVQIHYIQAVNELTDINEMENKDEIASNLSSLLAEIIDNESRVRDLLKARMRDLSEKIHYSLHHQHRTTHYQQVSTLN